MVLLQLLLLEQRAQGTADPKQKPSRNETPGSISQTSGWPENVADSKRSRKGLWVPPLCSAPLEAAVGCWSDQQVHMGVLVQTNYCLGTTS